METTEKEKINCYKIYGATLKELHDVAMTSTETWGTETLYEYTIIDRESMTPEQREKQVEHVWDSKAQTDLHISDNVLQDAIKEFVFEELSNGRRTDLYNTIYDRIMNSELKAIGWFNLQERTNTIKFYEDSMFINKADFRCEYVCQDNEKELKEKLKTARGTSYNYRNQKDEVVFLEKVEVTMRPHSFRDIDKRVEKAIKKFIRNELTYCIKSNKVIVPEEYLVKGEEGIKEWRQIKQSNNKSNSIEKQMLRQVIADKKKYAMQSMWQILNEIAATKPDWKVPYLEVDGRFNNSRTTRLVNQILNIRDKQGFINMSEEDIVRLFKDYWMDVLMEAYNNIKNMEIKKEA